MEKNKLIGLVVLCLIIIGSLSAVLAYSTKTNQPPTITQEGDYSVNNLESGALPPEPERGILRYSNPRYRNGTMIDWQSKR